jgi:hypothetical protein
LEEQDGRWRMARGADQGGRTYWSLVPSLCALRQWFNLVQKVHGALDGVPGEI